MILHNDFHFFLINVIAVVQIFKYKFYQAMLYNIKHSLIYLKDMNYTFGITYFSYPKHLIYKATDSNIYFCNKYLLKIHVMLCSTVTSQSFNNMYSSHYFVCHSHTVKWINTRWCMHKGISAYSCGGIWLRGGTSSGGTLVSTMGCCCSLRAALLWASHEWYQGERTNTHNIYARATHVRHAKQTMVRIHTTRWH